MSRPFGPAFCSFSLSKSLPGTTKRPWAKAILLTGLIASLGSCGGTAGAQGAPTNPVGSYGSSASGGHFFIDANEGGRARSLRLLNMYWGRPVDVFALDNAGERVLMHEDFVISQSLEGNGSDFELITNAVTSVQELTILRNVEDLSVHGGFEQFEALLRLTQTALDPVDQQGPSGTSGGSAGLYTMIPRNAALVLVFNDLIDPDTVGTRTVQAMTGIGLATPFEARIVLDRNFGDLAELDGQPGAELYSTRIIIDPTTSVVESFDISPPVPVNTQGFPASQSINLANLLIRIPTRESLQVGQFKVLKNLTEHPLDPLENGAWDASAQTQDVYRALRSGGSANVTGDEYNGFLQDREAPKLIGSNGINIALAPVQGANPDEFTLPLVVFESSTCAKRPERGDVISQLSRGIFADVIDTENLSGADALNVRVRLRQYPAEWDFAGAAGPAEWILNALGEGEFQTAFDPVDDLGRVGCFVRVSPLPSGFPDAPTVGLHPDSTFSMRFSEPMDRTSITAFDSLLLTRQELNPDNDPPLATGSFVVGQVSLATDLQSFTLNPELPLNHEEGQSEEYFLSLLTGGLAATDLAGNGLDGQFPAVSLRLDADEESVRSGGRVSRFSDLDEEPEDPFGTPSDYGLHPEWGGQHLVDLGRQEIFPRPVSRFTALADRTQAVPALMTQIAGGLQTPLSNLGSKTQILYRYMDFGWSLEDPSTANLDVTSISWAPVNGVVTFDSFSEFEIRMSHSRFAPDEYITPQTLWPAYPSSGLEEVFADNPLDASQDPPRVVHARQLGYQVNPGSVYNAGGSVTNLVPFPLNRDLGDPTDEATYLWRNTALLHRAGPDNSGSPPNQQLLSQGLPLNLKVFRTGQIRSLGLPLLVEFRCYPDGAASGLNSFDISIAANSSSRPYLRAFSTGGNNASGQSISVHPDTATSASGGFDPTLGGAATHGLDNSFYMGALDFVVRTSRSCSIWFPVGDPSSPGDSLASAVFRPAVMEPRLEDQPDGTHIDVDYRGAFSIGLHPNSDGNLLDGDNTPIVHMARVNATSLDLYGDHYRPRIGAGPWPLHNPGLANQGIVGMNGGNGLPDEAWTSDIAQINGARFYQVRLSFRSNIQTGLSPRLSALAVAWGQ